MLIPYKCPYCNILYNKEKRKLFDNWSSVRAHTSNCINNNKEYYIDLVIGPIHHSIFNKDINEILSLYPTFNIKKVKDIKTLLIRKATTPLKKIKILWTKDKILEKIKEFYIKNNKVPKQKDFINNTNFPSYSTVITHFGSWNNAILESGFNVDKLKKYSNIEIIFNIQKFFILNSRIPTLKEFRETYGETYIILFGSWNNTLIESGFIDFINKGTKNPNYRTWTKLEILQSIKKCYQETGLIPTCSVFTNNNDYPSYKTVINVFGSWNNAIKEAGFEPDSYSFGIKTKALDNCIYRSKAEAQFVNKWLYNKEKYFYEVKYPNDNKFYDFYLPEKDLYIEIDGGLRPQVMEEKIAINKQLGRKLLIIKTSEVNNFSGFAF